MPDDLPSRGHNQPPELILPEPGELQLTLDVEDKSLFDRLTELDLGKGQIPAGIEDDVTASRAVSFVAQCRLAVADLGRVHKRRKAPLLALTRFLDQRYLHRRDRFNETVIRPVEAKVEAYRRRLEARHRETDVERRRAAEAALAMRREAERLAAESAAREQEGNRRAAVDLARQAEAAGEDAERQMQIAALPPAPVRIHGEYGSTAFAVTRWKFYVSDPEALPANLWTPDEVAIQAELDAAIKVSGKPPDIPGVAFFEEIEGRIRRC